MRIALVLALVAGCLVTGGCFGNRCCLPCVEMCWPGNCCQSWDWYKECDLVEGREYRNCKVCDHPMSYEGMVVSRCYAEPVGGAPRVVAPPPADPNAGQPPTLPPAVIVEPEAPPAPPAPPTPR